MSPRADAWVLVGGSGFVGTALASHLAGAGHDVTVVDRHPPRRAVRHLVDWVEMDLLEAERVELPPGRIAVLLSAGAPAPVGSWTVPLDPVFGTARLASALRRRDVVLTSSLAVSAGAAGPVAASSGPNLPMSADALADWVARVVRLAEAGPCPPWRAAPLCRELAGHELDGRSVAALATRAQELLVAMAGPSRLRLLCLGEVVGAGQEGTLTALVRAARAGRPVALPDRGERSFVALADVVDAVIARGAPGRTDIDGNAVRLDDLAAMVRDRVGGDVRVARGPAGAHGSGTVVLSRVHPVQAGCPTSLEVMIDQLVGELARESQPVFEPPLAVVTPPRPARPDVVVERQAEALWHGGLKAGQRWSAEAADVLAQLLGLDAPCSDAGSSPGLGGWAVFPTASGTAALRLAVASVAGPARSGQVALLPSFTFPATAEVLVQLGYGLRFVDVDPDTWVLDPGLVAAALQQEPVGVVVGVDTFGNPLDYRALSRLCAAARVPFVADSAAALGSRIDGRRVGSQADAHAFSMSFAKTVIAGGAGGAVALPRRAAERLDGVAGWSRSELMAELHAITALDQLSVLEELAERRRALASRYRDRCADSRLIPQRPTVGADPVLANLVVRVPSADRARLARALDELGIRTKPYFPALHLTSHRDPSWAPVPLPATEALHREALALPLSSEMTVRDVDRVLVGLDRATLGLRRTGAAPVAAAF